MADNERSVARDAARKSQIDPVRIRSSQVDNGKAGAVLGNLAGGKGRLPVTSKFADGATVVNVGGYVVDKQGAELLQRALDAKSPEQVAVLRHDLAKLLEKFRGLDVPFRKRGRVPTGRHKLEQTAEPFPIDTEQIGEINRILEDNLKGRSLDRLNVADRRERTAQILRVMDRRNARQRMEGKLQSSVGPRKQ